MLAWGRGILVIMFAATLPLVAQDKAGDKKPESKDTAPKTEDKKPESKEKTPTKFYPVNKVLCKVINIDILEKLIELEVRVPTSRTRTRGEKITLKMADDVKVRNIRPLDDDGKLIVSAQEKQKRKGNDPKLPGYVSKIDSVKSDQIVEVELSSIRAPNLAGKKNPEDDEKLYVTMIVINEESPLKIEKKKK